MTGYFKKVQSQNKISVLKIINIVLLLIIISQFNNFLFDEIKLNEYVNTNFYMYKNSEKLEYKDILYIRNFILNDIDYNSPSIQFERPKIGWSIGTIIKKKKGLCGEGARLLYHIYKKFDVTSRRVYLHGNDAIHAILEVNYDNKWVIVETINSSNSENFRNLLDSTKGNIYDFYKIGPKRYHISPDSRIASFGYSNFSYLPLNGMFNNYFTKTEIYVHRPFNSVVNYILESPPLFYLMILIVLMTLLNIKKIIHSIKYIASIIPYKKNNP